MFYYLSQSVMITGATASYSQWSDGQDQDKGKPHVAQHMTAPYRCVTFGSIDFENYP